MQQFIGAIYKKSPLKLLKEELLAIQRIHGTMNRFIKDLKIKIGIAMFLRLLVLFFLMLAPAISPASTGSEKEDLMDQYSRNCYVLDRTISFKTVYKKLDSSQRERFERLLQSIFSLPTKYMHNIIHSCIGDLRNFCAIINSAEKRTPFDDAFTQLEEKIKNAKKPINKILAIRRVQKCMFENYFISHPRYDAIRRSDTSASNYNEIIKDYKGIHGFSANPFDVVFGTIYQHHTTSGRTEFTANLNDVAQEIEKEFKHFSEANALNEIIDLQSLLTDENLLDREKFTELQEKLKAEHNKRKQAEEERMRKLVEGLERDRKRQAASEAAAQAEDERLLPQREAAAEQMALLPRKTNIIRIALGIMELQMPSHPSSYNSYYEKDAHFKNLSDSLDVSETREKVDKAFESFLTANSFKTEQEAIDAIAAAKRAAAAERAAKAQEKAQHDQEAASAEAQRQRLAQEAKEQEDPAKAERVAREDAEEDEEEIANDADQAEQQPDGNSQKDPSKTDSNINSNYELLLNLNDQSTPSAKHNFYLWGLGTSASVMLLNVIYYLKKYQKNPTDDLGQPISFKKYFAREFKKKKHFYWLTLGCGTTGIICTVGALLKR